MTPQQYDSLEKYNHPDNWMTSEEASYIVEMEALEQEEREYEEQQKALDDYYSSSRD